MRKPIRIDRVLKDGDKFRWDEYESEMYFAPIAFHVLTPPFTGKVR